MAMLRRDLRRALAGFRGRAAITHDVLRGGMQRLRHLNRPAELFALFGDPAADLADRARDGLAAAAKRTR